MIPRRAMLGAAAGLALAGVAAADSPAEVRRALGEAGEPVPAAAARDLVTRCLALAGEAASDSDFLGAMSAAAAVCAAAESESAREERSRCLRTTAATYRDSRRWSALLSEGFAPPLEAFGPDTWRDELAAYDGVLRSLPPADAAVEPRLAAETAWARIWIRLHLDRNLDRLQETERTEALALVDALESRHGDLAAPGERAGSPLTYGARARGARYELTELAFRAPGPGVAGTDLAGNPLSAADYAGRVVVLDFWSTFCIPCLELVPHVRGMLDRYPGAPLTVLGVNADESAGKGAATAARVGMTWPSFWDGTQGPIVRAYRVQGMPRVFVLDGEGNLRFKLTGADAVRQGLEPAVQALLEESGYRRP